MSYPLSDARAAELRYYYAVMYKIHTSGCISSFREFASAVQLLRDARNNVEAVCGT